MIGGIFGAGIGAIQGTINQDRQYGNQLDLMNKQWELNEQAANANHKRAKELWDYTNYENQVEHLKNAGLNIGLMYGNAGQGGTTAGAGNQQGVSQPTDRSVEMGYKGQEMGLQLANMMSQIKLNESQAEKNSAEANKISGVDTALAESQKELNSALKSLNAMKVNTEAATYNQILQLQSKTFEEARALAINNEINESTKETQIQQVAQNYYLGQLTGIEKIMGINLTGKQAEYVAKQVEYYSYEALTGRITANAAAKAADAAAEKVSNDWLLGGRKLDLEQQRLLKDWIYGGINELVNLADKAAGIVTMFRKPLVKMGEKVFEQAFDNKGNSKGFKEIFKDFKME